jgi:hypothetical protein
MYESIKCKINKFCWNYDSLSAIIGPKIINFKNKEDQISSGLPVIWNLSLNLAVLPDTPGKLSNPGTRLYASARICPSLSSVYFLLFSAKGNLHIWVLP